MCGLTSLVVVAMVTAAAAGVHTRGLTSLVVVAKAAAAAAGGRVSPTAITRIVLYSTQTDATEL